MALPLLTESCTCWEVQRLTVYNSHFAKSKVGLVIFECDEWAAGDILDDGLWVFDPLAVDWSNLPTIQVLSRDRTPYL